MRKLKLLFLLPVALFAHFSFIVPQPGGQTAQLILNESLVGSPEVGVKMLAGAKLKLRDSSGKDEELSLETTAKGDHFLVKLPGSGNRIVHGVANLGISPEGRGPKPFLLLYYTKAIVGKLWGEKATVGGELVVELTPVGEPGKVFIQFNVNGKPKPDSEITVLMPDGGSTKVKTNSEGLAGPFAGSGRFGAWARYFEDTKGEHNGKAYDQVRHYGMVVFDAYAKLPEPTQLPEATSSFGAAVQGKEIYVYGGHTAKTHSYDTKSVSGKFQRYNVVSKEWEALPAAKPLQGLNIIADGKYVYRVGGMAPLNEPGAKSDIRSVSDASRFNVEKKAWEQLPALPESRSSHDVVIVNNKLYVLGGWNLRGPEGETWAKKGYVLDLSNPSAKWEEIDQPFTRRALIAGVLKDKIYILGGIQASGAVSTEVDVYDPATKQWSKGPAIPGPSMNGFSPAAATLASELYLSIGDGNLLRLDEKEQRWEKVSESSTRLAHRMVGVNGQLWILGGAAKGGNLALVEAITPQ